MVQRKRSGQAEQKLWKTGSGWAQGLDINLIKDHPFMYSKYFYKLQMSQSA